MYRAATLVIAAIAVLGLVDGIHHVARFIADDYNEGWNAYFADRALAGKLYPSPSELIINNYPPLSFYIVGLFGRLLGGNIVAGRILSIAAFTAISATIGIVVAARTGSRRIGLFAAAYFAALFETLPGTRIGMNDPQLLGHALMMIGLAVVFLGRPGARTSMSAALLMVAAGLVKHNLIAVPVAVTVWQAFRGKRAFSSWLAAALAAAAIGFLLVVLAWGWAPFSQMLAPRGLSLMKLLRDTQRAMSWMDVPLAVWVIQFCIGKRDEAFMLASSYVAAGLLVLPLFFGGVGTNANIAYDLVIALALATGLGLAQLPSRDLRGVLVLVLTLQIVVSVPGSTIAVFKGGARSEDEAERITRSEIDYLARHTGPALCENLALCYWAKKPFAYDAFNMGQAYRAGARDEQQLLAMLKARAFAVIQLDAVTDNLFDRFDGAFRRSLDANYVPDRQDLDRAFYVPRPSTETGAGKG